MYIYTCVCVMCSVITYMHIYMDMPLKRFKLIFLSSPSFCHFTIHAL